MSAILSDLQVFNKARESFLYKEWDQSILTLDSIHYLDASYIREELENHNGNSKYLEHLIESRPGNLVGVFDCPYHPYLKLEYTKIEDVLPTIEIDSHFNNIRCVKQIESTVGIGNEQVVAIFPENFRSVTVNDKHPVFYFVDKFANRHLKYTRPLLNSLKIHQIFSPLNSLSKERIGELISNWVNIHEASHRKGIMPIPQFLFEKSNMYTAALEELRADLITINKCFLKNYSENSDEYLTGLYVLAERLLAYPLFRDKTNFDAASSVIMWKLMNEKNVFDGDVDLIKIKESIVSLISFIADIEEVALKENTAQMRKQKLREMVVSFLGNYDDQFNIYNQFWGKA